MPFLRPTLTTVLWFLVVGIVCVPSHGFAYLLAKRCDMAVISVSSSAELYDALANAEGGDTIELAAGDYGELKLITWQTNAVQAIYDVPVTITSADPSAMASFSDVDLRGVQNLTFDGVLFDSEHTGASTWAAPFSVEQSSGVTFRNSVFQGELASDTGDPTIDGFATGKGLKISDSSDIVVENNEFSTWHRGLTVSTSDDVEVVGNNIHSIRSDGMNFTSVQDVLIEGNYFHNFIASYASGDHRDMIQFWTTNTDVTSENIMIRANIMDASTGSTTQSIFMRNEEVDQGNAGEEMFYRNITIVENLILNGSAHGITVGETAGLTIQNNTVLALDGLDYSPVPRINIAPLSQDVVVVQNATYEITGHTGQSGWTLDGNVTVQNLSANDPYHYSEYFFFSSMSGAVADYVVLPDSLMAQLSAGASSLQYATTPESPTPLFQVFTYADDRHTLVFDAQASAAQIGLLEKAGATFEWDFGDGAVGTGAFGAHQFSGSGLYDVSLTITLSDGSSATTTSQVGILGTELVSFDTSDGQFYLHAYGAQTALQDLSGVAVDEGQAFAVNLGGDGVHMQIQHEQIPLFFGSESFEISLSLQADQPGQSFGEVFRSHVNTLFLVTETGDIEFTFNSDREDVTLETSGLSLNDGQEHSVVVRLDGDADLLVLEVNGVLVASTYVEGAVRADNLRDFVFGNPWGEQNFDGAITAFQLNVGVNDYAEFSGPVSPLAVLPGDTDTVDPTSPPPSPNPEPDVVTDDRDPGGAGEPDPTPETIIDDSDSVLPSLGTPIIDGSVGNDALWGNQESNLLNGREGDDTLDAWSGDDEVYAGIGNDSVLGGDGNDTLNGDEGNDTLDGGSGNDILAGGWGEDSLLGQDGDDVLWGWLGNDTLNGGQGNDTLIGEEDSDLLDGWSGDDALYGGDGGDMLLGGDGADLLSGDEGADTLIGGNGSDTLAGGWGDDFVHGEEDDDSVFGWLGNDTLEGGGGNDTLHGEEGDDTVSGGEGNDLLIGGVGHDLLVGWLGDDTLDGGAGDDVMNGEAGNDVFVFFDGHGSDTIEGFEATNETEDIDLSGVVALTSFAQMQSSGVISQTGADVVIDTGTGMITLAGVNLSDLGQGDFVF